MSQSQSNFTLFPSTKCLIFYAFFPHKFIYLFVFGCIGSSLLCACFLQLWQAGATLRCGAWASHCSGFSCCGAWALGTWASVVVARRLQSTVSVVVAHWLSCSTACGIFLDQGSNPCPLHWQVDSLHHKGSPIFYAFILTNIFYPKLFSQQTQYSAHYAVFFG